MTSRTSIFAAAMAGFAAFAIANSSHAITLTFDGAICASEGGTDTLTCSNGSFFSQGYGDVAGQVDVSHRSRTGPAGASIHQNALKRWNDYSDLTDIAWGGSSSTGYVSEILIVPLAGYEVELVSADFGSYQDANRSSQVTIYHADSFVSPPYPSDSFNVAATHVHFDFNLAWSTVGYRLQWGPDGYDVGIDNVVFNVREVGATQTPEPATLALLGLSLAAVGLARRRRRS